MNITHNQCDVSPVQLSSGLVEIFSNAPTPTPVIFWCCRG